MISIRRVRRIFWCLCLLSLVRMSRVVAALRRSFLRSSSCLVVVVFHRSFLRSSSCLAGGCYGYDRSDVGFVAGDLHAVGEVRRQSHCYKGSNSYLCFACLVMGCMPLVLCCSCLLVYLDLGAWLLQGVVGHICAVSDCCLSTAEDIFLLYMVGIRFLLL